MARPKAARTRPQWGRRQGRGGGPDARDPGLQEAPAGCSSLRRRGPPERSGPARAAPPPPARASRTAAVTPRGPARTGRARALTSAGPAASSPPLSSPRSASRRPLAHLHASAQQSAEGGCTGPHPGASVPTRPPNPAAPRSKAPPLPRARGVGPTQAPPRPPLSCFGAPRGGAWEEALPGSAGRPRRVRHFRDARFGQSGTPVLGGRGIGCGALSAAPPRTCFRLRPRPDAPISGRVGRLSPCLFRCVPLLLLSAPLVLQHGVLQIGKDFFFPFLIAFKYLKYNNM